MFNLCSCWLISSNCFCFQCQPQGHRLRQVGQPSIPSFLLKHFHIPTRSELSSWNVYSIKPLFVGSEVHTSPHSWHCAVVLDRRTRRLEHVIPAFVSESCKLCQLNPSVLEALNIPCLRTVNSCYHRRFVKTSKSNAM